ncbi:MAG: GTPase, partial [Planctomycetota bacterium]
VITCSNRFQLEAAEKLLTGELAQTTSRIRSEIMECLTFLEAGLDFSGEDIEFITAKQAVKKLTQIKAQLEQLLADSIRYESVIDLPAVGIAGAPNAGKSSLLNKLLGKKRSIVSNKRKTTRDVLTGTMTLPHSRCVLFDCAGLIAESDNILDELAHQAAVNAIDNSLLTLLCIDVSKTDWTEDLTVRQMIETNNLIPVATKCDLLDKDLLADQLKKLKKLFGIEFLATSTKTNTGIDLLGSQIDKKIIESLDQSQYAIEDSKVNLGLTARQKHAVTQAVEYIGDSINELSTGNDEVVAMMLRSAYQGLSHIEQENINERILDNIFSKFCIGK